MFSHEVFGIWCATQALEKIEISALEVSWPGWIVTINIWTCRSLGNKSVGYVLSSCGWEHDSEMPHQCKTMLVIRFCQVVDMPKDSHALWNTIYFSPAIRKWFCSWCPTEPSHQTTGSSSALGIFEARDSVPATLQGDPTGERPYSDLVEIFWVWLEHRGVWIIGVVWFCIINMMLM